MSDNANVNIEEAMAGMMGGPFGNLMGMMDNVIANVDATEITEEGEETEEKKPKIISILTASPYNIFKYGEVPNMTATVSFICRTTDNDLITLNKSYRVTTDEQEMFMECTGLMEDNDEDFIGKIILNRTLINYLPTYNSSFNFATEEDFDKDENPHFVLTDCKSGATGEVVTVRMSTNIASAIMFIDSYLTDDVINEHDLMLAATVGSKVEESPAEVFVVDHVDSIVAMAGAEVDYDESTNPFKRFFNKIFKKGKTKAIYDTTVGLVAKVSRFKDKDTKENYFVLIPFNVGTSFSEEKFRGKTIQSIQQEYFGDADQYVSTLTIPSSHLYGVDKDYMVLRAKNKDKKLKIFLIDNSVKEELIHQINNF